MKEKLDKLKKNNTYKLIYKNSIKPTNWLLGEKLVYYTKYDVNSNITYFKAK